MKTPSKPKACFGRAVTGALAAVLLLGTALVLRSEENKAEASAKAPVAQGSTTTATTNAPAAPKSAKAARKKLSGAELYAMHCNRCHPERYPAERTAAQWKTIVLHMRTRANLPATQARTILTFLQENSGN
jgi:cytochrome c5